MDHDVYRVLFLSRRNSARSILAEAVLNREGKGQFEAHSAGVEVASAIDPRIADLLKAEGLSVPDLRPKHYSEFAAEGAADLDFVFTLSDTAIGEPLPEWPGMPISAHWSLADPLKVEGSEWEKKAAFARNLAELQRRIRVFISLPFASLDRMSLKRHVDEIGGQANAG